MKRTRASDTCFIAAPPKRVFDVLLAVDRYAAWWPAGIRVAILSPPPHGIGSVIELRAGLSRFRCRISAAMSPQRLVIDYIDGAHRGRGTWVLEPRNGGAQVTYSIDLVPHGIAARALSHIVDFVAAHARLMQRVFDGLAREAMRVQ